MQPPLCTPPVILCRSSDVTADGVKHLMVPNMGAVSYSLLRMY